MRHSAPPPPPQQPPPAPPQQPPPVPQQQQPPPLPEPPRQRQPLPPPPPYPYAHRSKHSKCASCLLATLFLLVTAIVASIACFFLFKPQDPKIAVNVVKFPAFSVQNGTANFTFFQYAAVRNPNRYSFSHYDSSIQLYSGGGQVGLIFIPAGEIAAGRTQYMSATFDVQAMPVMANPAAGVAAAVAGGGGAVVGPTMELESRMKLVGSVRVLKVFAHHVESKVRCRVNIEVSNGNVLGFHC